MMNRSLFTILTFSLLMNTAPVQAQSLESVLETMQRLRRQYGTFDRRTAGEFLNAVSWEHRAKGIVLLGKRSGNNCDQPKTNILVSCDFLVDANTRRGWDVIIAWDAEGIPTFGGDGVDLSAMLNSGERTLVAPVSPGVVPPVDPPVDPPTGPQPPVVIVVPPTPLPSVDLGPLLARLDQCVAGIQSTLQNVADGRRENQEFFAAVRGQWKRVLSYVLPIVGALVGGMQVAK